MKQFETIGYFVEYIFETKLIGTKRIDTLDREAINYYSQINEIATQDIILDNGKKIKRGQKFYTRLYPLNEKNIR